MPRIDTTQAHSWRINPASFAFTIFLGLLAALPALSIDISAPTLLLLPQALGTSATVAGLTLSLFMGGFGLGQLTGGRLSDQRGRRPVLLAGLACYTVAGVACALSQSGTSLAAYRCVQGIGAGACSVISFAMIQDLFEGETARSKRSYVTVIFGLVPILAPALGSLLSQAAGWRSVHAVLAAAAAVLWVVAWFGVAESWRAKPAARQHAASGSRPLWADARFAGLTAANALSYACIFCYIAGSPVLVIGHLGLSPGVFAAIFATTAIGLTAGAWFGGVLGKRGVRAAALLGPSLTASAAAASALAVVSSAGVTSGRALLPLLLVVLFARGIIAPNLQHLAIERQRDRAGSASAAVGVSQLLAGGLASAAVAGLLPSAGMAAVGVPMGVLAVAALAIWLWTAGWPKPA